MVTDRQRRDLSSRPASSASMGSSELDPALERLTDLERRSLLAEQARQHAHRLRTPLSVIDLIAETMRLESDADPSHADRLARIQSAAGNLATVLADSVKSTRFGDGPRRRIDLAALAADVVRTFGGDVVKGPLLADPRETTGLVEPTSVEAALVHALRLIGVGTDCNSVCHQRPQLQIDLRDGDVLLAITAAGPAPADIPRERADLSLMAKAAERIAHDHGGSLTLETNSATFRMPAADSGVRLERDTF